MVATQRMKLANEKASKYVTMRGNVPKSSVSLLLFQFTVIWVDARRSALRRDSCFDAFVCFWSMSTDTFLVCPVEGERRCIPCRTLAAGTLHLCCLWIRWAVFSLFMQSAFSYGYFSPSQLCSRSSRASVPHKQSGVHTRRDEGALVQSPTPANMLLCIPLFFNN